MLLPAWLYKGLFYGLLGMAGIAVLYYAYRPRREQPADNLPRAEIRGARWHVIIPWLPRIALIGGLAGAWGLNHVSVDVVLVEGDTPSARRMVRLGTPDYTLAPGTERSDHLVGYDTWILNESARPVRVETVSYGLSLGFGPADPTVIPPGTAYNSSSIDYIGPNDRPPSSLEVHGVEAKFNMTSRSWLTWDR